MIPEMYPKKIWRTSLPLPQSSSLPSQSPSTEGGSDAAAENDGVVIITDEDDENL